MVRPAGFEPATTWFEAKYSNPLSYGREQNRLIVAESSTKLYAKVLFYPWTHARDLANTGVFWYNLPRYLIANILVSTFNL